MHFFPMTVNAFPYENRHISRICEEIFEFSPVNGRKVENRTVFEPTSAGNRPRKLEIRISKFETNSKHKIQMSNNWAANGCKSPIVLNIIF